MECSPFERFVDSTQGYKMISEQIRQSRDLLLGKLKNNPDGLHEILADVEISKGLKSDDGLIPEKILADYLAFSEIVRRSPNHLHAAGGPPVVLIPGFLGSSLRDISGGKELIWIDPSLLTDGSRLDALKLATRMPGQPEVDADNSVKVVATGTVPLAYDLLKWRLSLSGYDTRVFAFDWRKNLDESIQRLVQQIRSLSTSTGDKKVRLIAHSQGSLVARGAISALGKSEADRLVDTLTLLGPATFGTLTAAMAISGGHEQLNLFQNWAINAPKDVAAIFQSMSGLYQLLPWYPNRIPSQPGHPDFPVAKLRDTAFWDSKVDPNRLNDFWGWAEKIDTSFFNARTRIILGEDTETAAAIGVKNGKMSVTEWSTEGDGVVLDVCAKLPGVRTFKAKGARHAWMAATFNVTTAVLKILAGNDPVLAPCPLRLDGKWDPDLVGEIPEEHFQASPQVRRPQTRASTWPEPNPTALFTDTTADTYRTPVAPNQRRLRVFSLDPLMASDAETADFATMEVEIPWEGPGKSALLPGELTIGPVGEYVEVVDVDPQSGRYYYPVDLNHPHVLAEHGLTPSETNPQFHQQMVYAVSMATIRSFEKALGRASLWSPRLIRDKMGNVDKAKTKDPFVRRLRIYPHAMRQRNAYYDPERKALLFGYFPAQSATGSLVQPGSTVFTCLSFDIVAHETTHALLDGLHRYFNTPSNRDVFAFHEAFADVVALLQRFSNQDLLRRQIRLAKGKLTNKNLMGQMAQQFGQASGGRGGLRQYFGNFDDAGNWAVKRPDPEQIASETEPHKRGALLVAAMFQALNTMYERRSSDLLDVARRDDGSVVFSRELESRLAGEAAKAAQQLLEMSIRALDYVPPVDIRFDDYLRGLITADRDVVINDKYRYRAAIMSAFSAWGIYSTEQQTSVPDDIAWGPPSDQIADCLKDWLSQNPIVDWGLSTDRLTIFQESQRLARSLHEGILKNAAARSKSFQYELGLDLDSKGNNRSIRRDAQSDIPVFEVHSVRPCRRIGPDGLSRRDVVIEIVQKKKVFLDAGMQVKLDHGKIKYDSARQDFLFRGGCTLILDGQLGKIRYVMSKNISSPLRMQAERDFRSHAGSHSLAANYFHGLGESNPFRLMHAEH